MPVSSIPLPISASWVFYIVAAMTVAFALAVVLLRNVIHSALALGACLFGVAHIYVLLHAQFLAVAQVLIYVGDITVLILFAVMLTRGVLRPHVERWGVPFPAGVAMALLLAAMICVYLVEAEPLFRYPSGQALQTLGSYGSVRAFSEQMLTTYLLPFEVASGILLMALVGAIILAREEHPRDAA